MGVSVTLIVVIISQHMCELSSFSHIQLFATAWTTACQSPLSMGFSRHEYWSGLPFPPLGNPPDPGMEPMSPVSPALAGGCFTSGTTWEALNVSVYEITMSYTLNILQFFQLYLSKA